MDACNGSIATQERAHLGPYFDDLYGIRKRSCLLAGRMDHWDRLPPATAINPEIGDIRGNHWMSRMQFAKANKAEVRQVGLAIRIAHCQLGQPRDVFAQHKG